MREEVAVAWLAGAATDWVGRVAEPVVALAVEAAAVGMAVASQEAAIRVEALVAPAAAGTAVGKAAAS